MRRFVLVLVCLSALVLVPLLGGAQLPFTPDLTHGSLRGLVYWWRAVPGFVGSDRLYDVGPYGAHGTLVNMGFSGTSGYSGTTRQGGYGQVNFDGVNDYVDTSRNAGVAHNAPFTICLWASAPVNNQGMLAATTPNSGPGGVFWGWGGNGTNDRMLFGIYAGGLFEDLQANSGSILSLNTWYFLCAMYDGSQTIGGMTLWINAVQAGVNIGSNTGFSALTDRPWRLGAYQGTPSQFFPGSLDSVEVYNRTLTPWEMAQRSQSGRLGDVALQRPLGLPIAAGPSAGVNPGAFFPFFR